jgi:hypothetical protein
MLDSSPLNSTEQRGNGETAACAAATVACNSKPKEDFGLEHIPNELLRALHGMCRFVATCGADPGQRLSRLRDDWNKMSPSSRESTRQLLDFMLPVLVPLREGMPGKKRKM